MLTLEFCHQPLLLLGLYTYLFYKLSKFFSFDMIPRVTNLLCTLMISNFSSPFAHHLPIFIIPVAWLIFFGFMLKNWHLCCEVVSRSFIHLHSLEETFENTTWPNEDNHWQTCSSLEQQQLLHLSWYSLKLVTHAKTIWSTHQKKEANMIKSSMFFFVFIKINSWNHKRCEETLPWC